MCNIPKHEMNPEGVKVAVIGSGAREHAFISSINQSPNAGSVFCLPGNGGTSEDATNIPLETSNIEEIVRRVKELNCAITIVGGETLLSKGIVDAFNDAGLSIIGPRREVAKLETDKIFSAQQLEQWKIPQPKFLIVSSMEEAQQLIDSDMWDEWGGMVVKDPGLRLGKGVVVPESREEAMQAIKEMMSGEYFGDPTERILLQQKLSGPEVSIIALVDTKGHFVLFPSVQDHKRIGEGDKGPNTGGMGAYTPVSFMTETLIEGAIDKIFRPTIEGMKNGGLLGNVFFLFGGLMFTDSGLQVLEFNMRMGDPEGPTVMALLKSPDLLTLLQSALKGELDQENVIFSSDAAVTTVMASDGYPGKYVTGIPISGLERELPFGVTNYHAGTRRNPLGKIETAGGRVLTIRGQASTLQGARDLIHNVIGEEKINFDGAQWRRDIAHQTINGK